MTSPFSGTRKKDRLGRRQLNMIVRDKSGHFDWEDVPVDTIKNMLVGSTIIHTDFNDDEIVIYAETQDKVLYKMYSGTEKVYVENGNYDEWDCYLEKGDSTWQDEQRSFIMESNEYIEKRLKRFPNG